MDGQAYSGTLIQRERNSVPDNDDTVVTPARDMLGKPDKPGAQALPQREKEKTMAEGYDPGAVQRGNLCGQCPVLIEDVGALKAQLQLVREVNDRDHREIKDSINKVFDKMDTIRRSASRSAGIAHDDTVDAGDQRTRIAGRNKATLIGLTGRQFVLVIALVVAASTPQILKILETWFGKGG
jgi:hypothetical protein